MIKSVRKYFLFFIFAIPFTTIIPQKIYDVKIGIVHSELTKQLLYKNNSSFYPILNWELFFLNYKIKYTVVDDEELDDYGFSDVDVLILPAVEILSDVAIENLKDFLVNGKSLFILGEFGKYNKQKKLRSRSTLNQLTKLQVSPLSVDDRISEKLTLFPSNFLTQDLDWKNELLILNWLKPLYVSAIPSHTKILGNYHTEINSNLDENRLRGIAAIEKDGWRILWFGFQISQVSKSIEEEKIIEELVFNGIDWLADEPLIWKNQFPSFYESATLFNCWTKNISSTIDHSAVIFKNENVSANYFITPSEIENSFDKLNELSLSGNINLLFDEFDYILSDSTEIKLTLSESLNILQNESRQEYFGVQTLNMIEEQSNFHKFYGFDYVLSPEQKLIHQKEKNRVNESLQFIPNYLNQVEYSDEQKDLRQSFSKLYNYANKNRKIVSHFYNDYLQNYSSGSETKLIEQVIQFANNSNSFITTFPELIKWQSSFNKIKISIDDMPDEQSIIVLVENDSDTIIEQLGLIISLPTEYKNLNTISYNLNLKYNFDTGFYNLLIPFLNSGQSISVEFEYED